MAAVVVPTPRSLVTTLRAAHEDTMKLKRLGLPKLAAISAAFLMVAVGLVLSRVTGDPEAVAAQDGSRAAALASAELVERAAATDESEGEESAEVEPRSEAAAVSQPAAPQPQAAAPASVRPRGTSAPKQPARTAKPTPTRSLPPLPPLEWGAASAPLQPIGPPPGVLWLSGVVQGNPRVAVLRRGESRFVVKEGDIIEDRYRVSEIGKNTITLKHGSRSRTLRVGQY
jgi:hypothetical protein